MRIAVNTRQLIENRLEGIGTVTNEVMKRIVLQHPEDKFDYYFDRGFSSEFGGIAAHYNAKVQKETKLVKPSSGAIIYNVHGTHARININSKDSSINIVNVNTQELFSNLRETIRSAVMDSIESKALLSCVDTLETSQGTSNFIIAYQNFIQTAANHITIVAPFLPALAQLLSK